MVCHLLRYNFLKYTKTAFNFGVFLFSIFQVPIFSKVEVILSLRGSHLYKYSAKKGLHFFYLRTSDISLLKDFHKTMEEAKAPTLLGSRWRAEHWWGLLTPICLFCRAKEHLVTASEAGIAQYRSHLIYIQALRWPKLPQLQERGDSKAFLHGVAGASNPPGSPRTAPKIFGCWQKLFGDFRVISSNSLSSLVAEKPSREFSISPWENCWLSQLLLSAESSGFSCQLYFFKDMAVQATCRGACSKGETWSFQFFKAVITSSLFIDF